MASTSSLIAISFLAFQTLPKNTQEPHFPNSFALLFNERPIEKPKECPKHNRPKKGKEQLSQHLCHYIMENKMIHTVLTDLAQKTSISKGQTLFFATNLRFKFFARVAFHQRNSLGCTQLPQILFTLTEIKYLNPKTLYIDWIKETTFFVSTYYTVSLFTFSLSSHIPQ